MGLETFLSGFRGREAQMAAEPMREIQQMGALQSIFAQAQRSKLAQQEQQESADIRATVAQAGGDPAKAIQALLAAGTPKSIELASRLKGLLPEPTKPAQPQLVTVVDPVTKRPVQRWVRPGETTGVDVGEKYEKPDEPPKPPAPSTLGRLLAERDALPPGDPRRALYEEALKHAPKNAGGGVNVTVSPQLSLGREGGNKVDVGLLDTTKGLMQLSAIEGQFRPEFQQTLPRIGAAWSSIKDKAGVGLAPQDAKFLQDFSAYKRNAINAMNEYIKSITGAAMSEAEAQRILRGMPNPGQGLLDGDSPLEFKAKLDDAMKQTRLSLARYEYIKRNGIALTQPDGTTPVIPLERMPQIMNERGMALEQQIKSSNSALPADQVKARVRQLLAKEFGLVQ